MANPRTTPGFLFGRILEAREVVRDTNEELVAAMRDLRGPAAGPRAERPRRPELPMRLLAAIVQAHISTDCVIGVAIPVPAMTPRGRSGER